MCIFYGHKLWFEDADPVAQADENAASSSCRDDGWAGLAGMADLDSTVPPGDADITEWPLLQGDPDNLIPEAQLPFKRLKLLDDEEEDVVEAVRLGKRSNCILRSLF